MSSIVSPRAPLTGWVSHSNERRWRSIRLGTSRDLDRRAKLRRVRGASTEAKRRLLGGSDKGQRSGAPRREQIARENAASKYSTAGSRHREGLLTITDPGPGNYRVCGAV